jgi:hypothetical protein
MKERPFLFMVNGLWLTAALFQPLVVRGADVGINDATNAMDVVCLTEQPAITAGESARLRAWASTPDGRPIEQPIKFKWQVTEGFIHGEGADVRWDLSAVKVESNELHKQLVATVDVGGPSLGEVRCAVEVFIGKREVATPDRGKIRGENLESSRRFLLPGKSEEPGYGLYSYLLFSSPPKDNEEKERYLKTTESYLLLLQDIDEYLSRHVLPSKLNATYIPLKNEPDPGKSNPEWAANVLSVYDYTAARILLGKLDKYYQQGPYLVSLLKPLSETAVPVYLFQDLTGVVPEQAQNWVMFFTYCAAQQRSWQEQSLRRFGLTMRNLIAVGGKVTPDILSGLEKMIQFKRGS